MADETDYEKRDREREQKMLVQMGTVAAMVGIIAGRQLSGKAISPSAVAKEAKQFGEALAKELG